MDQDSSNVTAIQNVQPHLRRVLGLWDLIIYYGIVLIQPTAPVGIFGISQRLSRGHVVTIIILAMFTMMLTESSYGRIAGLYPSAGSAYTYVAHGLNVPLGFLLRWAMVLDYLMILLIDTILGSLTLCLLIPDVPYVVWVMLISGGILLLNLRGIRVAAWANSILLLVMSSVVTAFVILAIHYLLHHQEWSGGFSVQPFYDPKTFDVRAVATATPLAALIYIGFDRVTMLAEEVREPKRTVSLANVVVCLFAGIISAVEVYLGQRIWPRFANFIFVRRGSRNVVYSLESLFQHLVFCSP